MIRLSLWLVLCLSLFTEHVLASVLAIDYGSDWIKASLMAPGVPFDVLLNKDSKRKIQSTVGWKKEDRLFGSDAFNIAGRFPTDSFSSLKILEAVPYESGAVSFYTQISTADLVPTSRGTVAARRSDGSEWSVEELIAMQFAYVRDLAESAAGEKVSDVVITVPPYYTQHERDAVVDAVEIAGMRTLALIHDGTAVAVNYAMTRTFADKPEYHIIYDAGASGVRATVAAFSSVSNDAKAKKDATHITIAGVGFDRNTGGTELDRRLRELLINDFNRKHKRDIRADKRGMAKLWKEAGRVKAILSANADATASVESLAWDIDFRTKVTRNDFEKACQDLKVRFTRPVFDALSNAGLSLDNITSVILTGGSSRTPMIQGAVKAAVGESKIALNVNADEAAVLGAALHGASLSRQFKTKDIRVTDIEPYDIQVSYQSEVKSEHARPRTINTLVFPAGSKLGTKKTLTFKRKDDFTIGLTYKNPPSRGFPTDILQAEIKGIPEAIQNLTELGAAEPVVKATVVLSESGFVSVQDAVAFGEVKDDSLAGKLKGLFGNSGSSSADESTSESATGARDETPSPSASAAAEKKGAVTEHSIPLEVKVTFPALPPMSVAEKRAARERLQTLDREESFKRRKEEARNSLEGYLYRVRDLLEDDSSDSPFMKCSQEQERKRMSEELNESINWLHEHGDDAETMQYIERRSSLESLEQPIVHRYKEIEEFPHALNNSQMWNWSTRMFLTDAKANLTAAEAGGPPSKYTKEELEGLEKTLKEHERWLNEMVEKQKRVKMNEDPVLESSELRAKVKPLESQLQRLVKKKAPRVKKPSTSSATASSSGSESSTARESSETASSTGGGPGRHEEL